MDAETLYEIATRNSRRVPGRRARLHACGLTRRTFIALRRAGYGGEGRDSLDVTRLWAEALDGTIIEARGIGPKSVREICTWLVQKPDSRPVDTMVLSERSN